MTLLLAPDIATLPPVSDRAQQARFEQTVPRRLVHRAAVSEVMMTDAQQLGPTSFLLGAQWPRAHSFYGPVSGSWHDPLLWAETIRQAGLLVAHEGFGVPQGTHFLTKTLNAAVTPAGLRLGAAPANVTVEMTCSDVEYRGRNFAGMKLRVQAFRDGEWIGYGEGELSCLSPQVYRRLRGEAAADPADGAGRGPHEAPPGEPLTPWLVGREHPDDVVLAATLAADSWLLRVDRDHPVLFDHPVDHVPGMVLMEAMRQAAHRVCSPYAVLPADFRTSYHHFVEFDRPCLVTAEAGIAGNDGRVAVKVSFEQDGRTAMTGTVLASQIPSFGGRRVRVDRRHAPSLDRLTA